MCVCVGGVCVCGGWCVHVYVVRGLQKVTLPSHSSATVSSAGCCIRPLLEQFRHSVDVSKHSHRFESPET